MLNRFLRWSRHPVRRSRTLLALCEELVRQGDLARAVPLLTELLNDSEFARDARHLLLICKQLRRSRLLDETVRVDALIGRVRKAHDEGFPACDPRGVLVRESPGAAETMIVFLPKDGTFWVTLSLLHHYLRAYPVHLVYARDDDGLYHMAGHAGLGTDYRASLAGFAAIHERLGAGRLYCIGASTGGYAALRFGLDLSAEAVLTFSGMTTVARQHIGDENFEHVSALHDAAPEMADDLAAIYAAAPKRPRTILCYGVEHEHDRRFAEHMAEVPDVTLFPLRAYDRHDSLSYFILNDRFDQMFSLLRGTGA